MLAAVMPFAMVGGVCHSEASAATALADHAMVQQDASPESDCEMQSADDCCTHCCVAAPAPRLAVAVIKYAAYRPHVAPTVDPRGWSTAPPQRPPRA